MDIVFRAAFAWIFIVFVLRVMGRRELSSLSASDLILLVSSAILSKTASRNLICR
jgi:uncharacterized membrane protein YcaP (DUF421 family)